MTRTDMQEPVVTGVWAGNALAAIRAAGEGLTEAKRSRSLPLIACAQVELQAAVDVARDLDVEWGRIGLALGIARGNAYQKFRRKAAASSEPSSEPRRGHDASGIRFAACS